MDGYQSTGVRTGIASTMIKVNRQIDLHELNRIGTF
jgi:hypothetical protein